MNTKCVRSRYLISLARVRWQLTLANGTLKREVKNPFVIVGLPRLPREREREREIDQER